LFYEILPTGMLKLKGNCDNSAEFEILLCYLSIQQTLLTYILISQGLLKALLNTSTGMHTLLNSYMLQSLGE
jgi:hypothetical protein